MSGTGSPRGRKPQGSFEETLKLTDADAAYFWATHSGAELDLLLLKRGRRIGIEVKRQDAPRLTPSMRSALVDLQLESLTVLYPGDTAFELAERVRVLPLSALAEGDPGVLLPIRRRARRAVAGSR